MTIEELLLRWEEQREAGDSMSLDELCRDCPELRPELELRILQLARMDWLDGLCQPIGQGLSPGAEPVSGYRLVRRLGRGGYAEVWQAKDNTGQTVALKIVPGAGDAGATDAIKELHHPHLLPLLDCWQTEESLVIALELADCTLHDRLQQYRSQGQSGIPGEQLLTWFQQAAEGIDFLHSRNIMHRDVKPQNLLLVGETLKVADFGLARVTANSVTGHTGSLTMAYAAPEFFDGITARNSDQYSLAVTYCQLRGGRLPFEGTPARMVANHLHRRPDLSMLPAKERPAVGRALSKRPEARWASCRDFVAAIPKGKPGLLNRRTALACAGGLAALAAIPPVLRLVEWRNDASALPSFDTPNEGLRLRALACRHITGAKLNAGVAFTNGDGGPTLWNTETGRVIEHVPWVPGPCVALAPFSSPFGLTGDDDGNVILWDLDGSKVWQRYRGHDMSVSCVAFSPDGRAVLSASCDRTVRLWDRTTAKPVQCMKGHQGIVFSAAFSPDGRHAVSGSWDGTVRLWDLATGTAEKVIKCGMEQVLCVDFSLDGVHVLAGGTDRVVRLLDMSAGREVRRFEGHKDQVTGVSFCGYNRMVSCGGPVARLWDVTTGRLLCASPRQPTRCNAAVCIGGDKRLRILLATDGKGLHLWETPPI